MIIMDYETLMKIGPGLCALVAVALLIWLICAIVSGIAELFRGRGKR